MGCMWRPRGNEYSRSCGPTSPRIPQQPRGLSHHLLGKKSPLNQFTVSKTAKYYKTVITKKMVFLVVFTLNDLN